jgi:hypothetical protein
MVAASASVVRAQQAPSQPPADVPASEPPASAPAAAAPAASAERDAQVTRVEAELQRMQAELDAQRKELAEQRAELDAYAAQSAEAGTDALSAHDAEQAGLDAQMLRVYGFADMGLQRAWGPLTESVPGGTQATTFVLGNVNLYFDSTPAPDWRFLAELRLGLFPHGAVARGGGGGGLTMVSTRISDDGASNGGFTDLVWHGVLLERAHIDWLPSDEFNLRAGWFLTPYGIWNVDHGSPTRLMIEPPIFITLGLFPQRQLGVEAFGRFPALPWTFGYHAYVSNGRQPGQVDFEDDKAVGGRLWAQARSPVPITIGASGYTGRYEDVAKTYGLMDGQISATTRETIAYRDYALSGDLSIDIDRLRLRTEGVVRWQLYEDGKRPSSPLTPGTTSADTMYVGAYVMAAYQLPWHGLEPVAVAEIVRVATFVGEYSMRFGGGLNVYLSEVATLRTSYVYAFFFDGEDSDRDLSRSKVHSVASRLILAF